MDKCPVCRATIAGSPDICRRCRADLTTLVTIERQATALARCAVQSLANGDLARAKAVATVSLFQQDNRLTRVILQFIERQTSEEYLSPTGRARIPPTQLI